GQGQSKQSLAWLATKNCLGVHLPSASVWPLTFLPYAAPWIFVAGRKKEGALSERSEFAPSPPRDKNPRRGSPHRARLSLPTFFGKTKKVGRPRQGTKGRWTTNIKPQQPTIPINTY
ncbi:hypothetical protein, partial [Ralstonia solanacearum]|uniref:hypothetical protein n=1 Tax=Ralstonia solanacearum TaxID=305 RepID=UPI001E33C6FF